MGLPQPAVPIAEGVAAGGTPARSRLRSAAAALLTPVMVVGTVVGAHAAWNAHAERRFVAFVDALRQAGEAVEVAELAPRPVPDDQNVAVDLTAATRALNLGDPSWRPYFAQGTPALPLDPRKVEVIRAVMAANHGALARMDAAAGKSAADWSPMVRETASASFSPSMLQGQGVYYVDALATLLSAAALAAHQEGDEQGALARVGQLLLLSDVMAERPTLQAYSYSLSREATALATVAHILPDLRVGDGPRDARPWQVRALVNRLLDTRPRLAALRRNARVERARQLGSFTDERARAGRRAMVVADPWGAMPASDSLPRTWRRRLMRPLRLAAEREGLERLGRTIASLDGEDPAHFLTVCAEPVPEGGNGDDGLFVRHLNVALNDLAYRHCAAMARRQATGLALACSLYRAEHGGALPKAGLLGLVPKYVDAVPSDPLAPGGRPFAYAADSARPRVYSVWLDGADDGGRCDGCLDPGVPTEPLADLVIDLNRRPTAGAAVAGRDVDGAARELR